MRLCQQVLPVLFISRGTVKSTEFRNKMPIDSEIKQKKIHCSETKRKLSHQIVLFGGYPTLHYYYNYILLVAPCH